MKNFKIAADTISHSNQQKFCMMTLYAERIKFTQSKFNLNFILIRVWPGSAPACYYSGQRIETYLITWIKSRCIWPQFYLSFTWNPEHKTPKSYCCIKRMILHFCQQLLPLVVCCVENFLTCLLREVDAVKLCDVTMWYSLNPLN